EVSGTVRRWPWTGRPARSSSCVREPERMTSTRQSGQTGQSRSLKTHTSQRQEVSHASRRSTGVRRTVRSQGEFAAAYELPVSGDTAEGDDRTVVADRVAMRAKMYVWITRLRLDQGGVHARRAAEAAALRTSGTKDVYC